MCTRSLGSDHEVTMLYMYASSLKPLHLFCYCFFFSGGLLTLQDLALYEPIVSDPLQTKLKNKRLTVVSTGLPTSGAIFNLILSIMDGKLPSGFTVFALV